MSGISAPQAIKFFRGKMESNFAYAGADPGGGGCKIVKKNMIFWHKIMIFHTKYPLSSTQFF